MAGTLTGIVLPIIHIHDHIVRNLQINKKCLQTDVTRTRHIKRFAQHHKSHRNQSINQSNNQSISHKNQLTHCVTSGLQQKKMLESY